MEASRPLLGGERDEHADGDSTPRSFECLPRWRASPSAESHTSSSSSNGSNGASHHEARGHRQQGGGRKSTKCLPNGNSSSMNGNGGSYQNGALLPSSKIDASKQYAYIHDGEDDAYDRADSDDDGGGGGSVCCCFSSRRRRVTCAEWPCWKWLVPERIADYDDFATTAQMGEIYFIRQKAREYFEPNTPDDEDMVRHLWNGLFPTLPYEGRVNSRWRDVGFQNDDPASDLRSSGRLALKMMLFFADHLNDEFKRMVRDNRFPVCLCAINLLEVLLSHLKLKDSPPLVCPCCGTENAERETAQPNRARPELRGFARLLDDAAESAQASGQLVFSAWAVELALAQVFMHSMLVLDAVWARQLRRDPTATLMHFRDALLDTRERLIAFLSRRNSPLTLVELHAWSFRQRAKLKAGRPTV